MPDDSYRILFEQASDAHLIVRGGGIWDCNEAAVTLLACASKQEVLALHPATLSPERQPDGRLSSVASKEMDALAQAHGVHRFEWIHRKATGEDFPVAVTLNSAVIDGAPALIAVWHDLTEIKRREVELLRLSEALQQANDRMTRELEVAARVQAALLPKVLPDVDGIEIAWAFLPCDELAGDILNVFLLDDRHLGFYVLDVSGHGVASSLLSVTASHFLSPLSETSFLRSAARQGFSHATPREIATRLNGQFQSRGGIVQFLTLFCGVLDLDTYQLDYTCAAHPGAVRMRQDGTWDLLEHPGLPIGVVSHAEYHEASTTLCAGDRLYIFSDGVPEARDEQGTLFGADRIVEALQASRGSALQASIDGLIDRVSAWCPPEGPQDDISLVALELAPPTA